MLTQAEKVSYITIVKRYQGKKCQIKVVKSYYGSKCSITAVLEMLSK